MSTLRIKRVYDPPSRTDGWRVLVDRLWPRGISKERARLDAWAKEVAPSAALRAWFGHDPQKWQLFRKKYRAELEKNPAVDEMKKMIRAHATVTLVYGARDATHNQAVVAREFLLGK